METLADLGAASRLCSNLDYRETMRSAHYAVVAYGDAFHAAPTEVNLRNLIGAWSHATRVYENRPSEGDPAPLSGAPEATVFEQAKLAA